ncbi:MAG: glutamate-cysteine ligase family protein, partial [Pirellulales bacterium]
QFAWSNELALHVLEFKTNGPAASLDGLAAGFQQQVARANELLRPLNACLLPAAMHPTMNPHTEMQLWPHEHSAVYEAFNRIFDCRGHGWANLQSIHLNLPFADDEQFGRLHAAIRLLLPLLPALAASSPLIDGRIADHLDQRLAVYRGNAAKIPSVSGAVIPEPVYTRAAYEREILLPMYREIAPHDPEGVLQHEFLNARGAIARWDRQTIEIRVLDVQECPAADVAILSLIVAVLRELVDERHATLREQQALPQTPLVALLAATIRDADQAPVADPEYLATLGLDDVRRPTAGEVWRRLLQRVEIPSAAREPLDVILREGPLARRMLARCGSSPSATSIKQLCRDLAECLAVGRMLDG